MSEAFTFRGDFRIIKLDNMFHVVFRPDSDPEWFRIVASFFTYERAWLYCDLERVTSFEGDSTTTDEMKAGTRGPPVFHMPDPQSEWDAATTAREVLPQADAAVPPIPPEAKAEVCDEQPEDEERPKDYDSRMFEQAVRAMPAATVGPEPIATPVAAPVAGEKPGPGGECVAGLTEREAAVMRVFEQRSDSAGLIAISLGELAAASRTPLGSVTFLRDTLASKGFIVLVEKGKHSKPHTYRVVSKAGAPDPVDPPKDDPAPTLEDATIAFQRSRLPGDKIWCDQCEMGVTVSQAVGCKSRFCKAKAAA